MKSYWLYLESYSFIFEGVQGLIIYNTCLLYTSFYTDVIYELREKLDSYPEHYAVGQVLFMDICEEINEETLHKHGRGLIPYGSIMAKKEYFERVGGYSEHYTEWGGEDDHLRLSLIHILFRAVFRKLIFLSNRNYAISGRTLVLV